MFNFFFDNKIQKTRLIIFLYSIFIILTFIFLDKIFFYNNIKTLVINKGQEQILERERTLINFTNNSEVILKSIRNTELFKNYLDNPNIKTLEKLKKQYLLMTNTNTNFMQLRYIDKNGYEILRVDRKNEFEKAFYPDKLQNKANRYYFKDSITKPLEEVWFSSLDLNIEKGVLERPYKPTLRAILPIKFNGKFNGIIIINYFMNEFLNKFKNLTLYNMVLVDSEGNTLIHYDNNKSWGLFKKEKFNIKFEYKEYKSILEKKVTKNDNYISKKMNTPISNKPILILEPKKEYLEKEIKSKNIQYIYITAIVLFLTFIATYFVSKLLRDVFEDLKNTKRLNERLNELNERFYTILNTTNDAILILNNKKEIEFVNKACSNITGLNGSELLHKEISIILKENIKDFSRDFEEVLSKNISKTFENNCFSKSGNKIIILITLIKIKNQNNILFIARDITKLKEQEDRLKAREQVLMQQNKIAAMGEMLENIAHQWRQPLSIISTSASGIQLQNEMKVLNDDLMNDELESIISTTNHLSKTIEDFKSFFNNKREIEYFEISTIVNKTLYLMTSRFTNSDINIQINKEQEYFIKGIKNELIQSLMNIFNNSKDELDKKINGEEKLIIINISDDINHAMVEIVDNAGGVSPEIISKIFESNFTTKGVKGVGVGLYMTKKIIEEDFNGKIEVENKNFVFENKKQLGASFKIFIPIIKEET